MSQIFLLTKPPSSPRAQICLKMAGQSKDARIYLAGDGVYNLLGGCLDAIPPERVFACREDMEARGISLRPGATVPERFYEEFVADMMRAGEKVYSF